MWSGFKRISEALKQQRKINKDRGVATPRFNHVVNVAKRQDPPNTPHLIRMMKHAARYIEDADYMMRNEVYPLDTRMKRRKDYQRNARSAILSSGFLSCTDEQVQELRAALTQHEKLVLFDYGVCFVECFGELESKSENTSSTGSPLMP
ncbi:MAG: hypothetical protein CMH28_02195 [Micavibrio sp.]|nr:hypothetical protein [Micavibrio sp.]|tara:strand:- start:226 stop:672 length:447 start_codon:yes stop_codon:yes gene_type:complete